MLTRPKLDSHVWDSRAISEVEDEGAEEITVQTNKAVTPDFRSLNNGLKPQSTKMAPMKYRNRLAIASTILQVARLGTATKTRLMYGAFLSFAQINEYLGFLTRTGLIMSNSQTRVYFLTDKGLKFIAKYDELSNLIDEPEDDRKAQDNVHLSQAGA